MEKDKTARKRFEELNGLRNGILRRAEQYARYTLPKVFPIENFSQDSDSLAQTFQSLGAQAVNHLVNKLMMSLFAPSRPFFRLELNNNAKQNIQGGPPEMESQVQASLSTAEKEASLQIDKQGFRSKLYQLLKLLVITGNALMILEKNKFRVLSMRNYVVKRDPDGEVYELVICEKVHTTQLSVNVQQEMANNPNQVKADEQGFVPYYRWIIRQGDKYHETQWVDQLRLDASHDSSYPADKLKYRAVTWDLASGADYGTSLVEDYEGDFASLSMLSEATLYAAILASEFRWLVNPTGQTSVDDFMQSRNGQALPGQKQDIELLHSGVDNNLQTQIALQQVYINRIGSGFMLQSAITRNAERVTAEEIRMNAEELEGGLGGGYSRIAADVQLPVAYWVMESVDKSIWGSNVSPVIITGLAALSRTGDRDRLLMFGSNLASVLGLPPQILDRLRLRSWMSDLAAAEGLDPNKYVLTDEEYSQMQQQRQQQALAMRNAQQQIEQQNQPQE